MNPALVDASALVALFGADEPAHLHYRNLLADRAAVGRLHTTWPCVTEAAHLLRGNARYAMLRWLGLGAAQVFPLDQEALLEMAPWMQAYSQPPRSEMDLADASLYWLAADTGVTRVLTLDRRDFSRYRLPDGRWFEIL